MSGVPQERITQTIIPRTAVREAQERLEELLLEGLNSGESTPMTEQDWKELHAMVRQRAVNRDVKKAGK